MSGCRLFIYLVCFLTGCVYGRMQATAEYPMQHEFPEALSHGHIIEVTEDVFVVFGTNVVVHNGVRIQTSRTMTIIREQGRLTLINSIRLNEAGLRSLEQLGQIQNVIRLGAFHGRDDAFYQKVYKAALWADPQMDFEHGEVCDHDLGKGVPIAQSKVIVFKTTKFKEALLLVEKAGGILIACDSIKNWQVKDAFFSNETFETLQRAGSIGMAKIDRTWLQAMKPSKGELETIRGLNFSILISAHGPALKDRAQKKVFLSIQEALQQEL